MFTVFFEQAIDVIGGLRFFQFLLKGLEYSIFHQLVIGRKGCFFEVGGLEVIKLLHSPSTEKQVV